jgi:hypothetical protein
MKDPP